MVSIRSQADTPGEADETLTPTINLPDPIVVGDRLLAIVSVRLGATTTWPAGWEELLDLNNGGGDVGLTVATRIADGSEGSSIGLTFSALSFWRSIVFALQDADGAQTPEIQTATEPSGQTATPNPPSITVSWGAEAGNFFVALSARKQPTILTSGPSGYTNVGPADNSILGWGVRAVSNDTEDPDVFTWPDVQNWLVATIGVRGSSGVQQPALLSSRGVIVTQR